MKYPTLCLLLCTAILTSCASRVTSIQNDVDQELEQDVGYLLLGIDTTASLDSVDIFGAENIRLTHTDLRPDSRFILIDLKAGDYSIRKVRFSYHLKTELTDGFWDFTVLPGTISYVGHLEVIGRFIWAIDVNSSIELTNRSTEALQFMEERFPNILSNRSLQYSGPGKDRFLEWIMEQDQGKRVQKVGDRL